MGSSIRPWDSRIAQRWPVVNIETASSILMKLGERSTSFRPRIRLFNVSYPFSCRSILTWVRGHPFRNHSTSTGMATSISSLTLWSFRNSSKSILDDYTIHFHTPLKYGAESREDFCVTPREANYSATYWCGSILPLVHVYLPWLCQCKR